MQFSPSDSPPAHHDVGIAAASLRQPLGEKLQGEEAGRTRNHDPAESGGGESAKLRDSQQTQDGDVEAEGDAGEHRVEWTSGGGGACSGKHSDDFEYFLNDDEN